MEVTKRYCCIEGCDNSVNNHKWGLIEANANGWFFSREGKAYCPEHVPEWVEAWRASKNV